MAQGGAGPVCSALGCRRLICASDPEGRAGSSGSIPAWRKTPGSVAVASVQPLSVGEGPPTWAPGHLPGPRAGNVFG